MVDLSRTSILQNRSMQNISSSCTFLSLWFWSQVIFILYKGSSSGQITTSSQRQPGFVAKNILIQCWISVLARAPKHQRCSSIFHSGFHSPTHGTQPPWSTKHTRRLMAFLMYTCLCVILSVLLSSWLLSAVTLISPIKCRFVFLSSFTLTFMALGRRFIQSEVSIAEYILILVD